MFVRILSTVLAAAALSCMATAEISQPRSFGIERGTGNVICTDDSDRNTLTHADDPSYALAALWDQMYLGGTADPCGAPLQSLDGGTWGKSAPFRGADAQGRSAEFRLYVLHDRYAWKLGSSQKILDGNTLVQFNSVLNTPQFFEQFCAAKAVMSVGAASHEGPTALNHRLAGVRAQTVIGALGSARERCTEGRIPILYAINIGEHQNQTGCTSAQGCSGGTGPQRRVVIVAAENLTIGINLKQALRQGLAVQSVFQDFSISDYDMFEIEPF